MRVIRTKVRVLAAGCGVAGLLMAAVPAAADPVVPGGVTFCGLAGEVANRTGYGYPTECLVDPDVPGPVAASPDQAGPVHDDVSADAVADPLVRFVAMMTGFVGWAG